jgi:hypothetical protein
MDSPEPSQESAPQRRRRGWWWLLLLPLLAGGAFVAWKYWPRPAPEPPPDLSQFPPAWHEVTLVDEGYMRLKPCGRGTNAFCLDSLPDGYYLEHTRNDTTAYGKVVAFHVEEQGRYLVDVELSDGKKAQYELRLLEEDMSIAAWSLDGKPVALMMAEGMYKALKKEFDECKAAAQTSGWYYGNVGTLADSTLDGLLHKAVRRSNTVFLGITDSTLFRLAASVRHQSGDLAVVQMGTVDHDLRLEDYTLLCIRRDSLWITLNMQQQGDFLSGRMDTLFQTAPDQWVLMMRGERLTNTGKLAYQYPAVCNGPDRQLFRLAPQCLTTQPVGCPATFIRTSMAYASEGEKLSLTQQFATVSLAADCAPTEVQDSTHQWVWDPATAQFVGK